MRPARMTAGSWRAGLAALGIAVLLAWPPTAAAQDSIDPSPDVASPTSLELTAYVGVILPLSKLGARGDSVRSELSTKPAFAAGLDYWFGGSFGIGLMAGYTRPQLNLTTIDAGNFQQNIADLGTVDYLHAEALVLFRPELKHSAGILLPYVGAGVGYVDLSVPGDSGFEDSSGIAFAFAAGTHLRMSDAVHLRLDVRDLVSSFSGGPFEDSNLQHDVFVQVGLGVGL